MPKKSRAQLQREQQAKQNKEKELKKLKSSINDMKLFGISKEAPDHKPNYDHPRYVSDSTRCIRSNNDMSGTMYINVKDDLSPEMLAREAVAQEEIKRKRKRVAPAYNKGGYQYITDDTDPKTLGRKI